MLNFSEYIKEAKKNGCNCWDGYKRVAGTEPCAPGSCVKESLEEGGLWANIHAKRKRIKAGSGERMRKPGSKGAPSDADLKAANEEVLPEASDGTSRPLTATEKNKLGTMAAMIAKEREEKQARDAAKAKAPVRKEELSADEQFDLIEEIIEQLAQDNGIDSESIWETLESVDDTELLEYAVDAKGHKSSTGGLTQKGRDSYNAKGGNLQAPVTTPPSKLKPGSKAANRRKSFCARMGGMEGPMKDDKGRPTRKALALRKWNC